MTSLILRNPEMEDFFDRFFNSYPQTSQKEDLRMPLELVEREDNFILKASLPGMKKDDINIEVSEDEVSISAEYKTDYQEDKDLIHRSEFIEGKISRTLPLPQKINHQKVKADYKDGILTLILPKSDTEINKTVKISL